MIDLSSYPAIESAIFVKWTVPDHGTDYISDYHTDITFGGNLYTNTGNLLNVSGVQAELKASKSQLVISFSGIPTNSIYNALTREIKGSALQVYRGIFDPSTHALIDLSPESNPVSKFKGIVTNYAITDDVDNLSNTATSTITLTCNSIVEVLQKKKNGRRTNPTDFEGEQSMDRVRALSRSNFNFGAPN